MKRKKKKQFRVGQSVRSAYDPQRSFRIDKSVLPERLFHEEGSDRWYTRSELLALREANKRPAGLGAESLAAIGKMRSLAFRGVSGRQIADAATVRVKETRKCLECEAEFTPKRKRQKFCRDAHRTAYWKRRNHAVIDAGSALAVAVGV